MHRQSLLQYKELPLDQVVPDPEQGAPGLESESEHERLHESIQRYGILSPLVVSRGKPDRYLLIDGRRRYRCVRELGLTTVPCTINPEMSGGERQVLRYQLHHS